MKTLPIALVLFTMPGAIHPVAAQDVLEQAKAEYAAAAYEDALSTLTRAAHAGSGNRVEVEQYRAFCLIALGRMADAGRAVAAIVEADPKYVPSPSVASPRVLSLVSEMRGKELPGAARRLLDDGRTAFTEKDFARAHETFDLLLDVLEDDAMAARPESRDLRVIAEGFAALATAVAAPPDQPEEPVEPADVADVLMVPPVAVQQDIPTWIPPDIATGSREYRGAIRVRIGPDGRVSAATLEQTTHPVYDARLLRAARSWVYAPAMRNGLPVESEKLIEVHLNPRE